MFLVYYIYSLIIPFNLLRLVFLLQYYDYYFLLLLMFYTIIYFSDRVV